MKAKYTLQTFEEMQTILKQRVEYATKPIAIIAGHYRLNGRGESAFVPCDEGSFGAFSKTTLDFGIEIYKYAEEKGKKAKIVPVVDDHSGQKIKNWYMNNDEKSNNIRETVQKSLTHTELNPDFLRQLELNNLDKSILQGSEKYKTIFQESVYREKFYRDTGLDPGCSGEYRLILEELTQKGFGTVIAYIPVVCQGPTCSAVNFYNNEKTNPSLKISQAYLTSRNENDTAQLMLEDTIKNYGGIQIHSANKK